MISDITRSFKFICTSWNELIQRRAIQRKNLIVSLQNLFLKYDQNSCHWVSHSKMKPIDTDELIKNK